MRSLCAPMQGVGLGVEHGVEVAARRRQLAHVVHAQDELGVTPDVGLAHVGGQRPLAEVVLGHAELAAGLGQPALDGHDLRLEDVEPLLGGVEVGLDGGDLAVERRHLPVERPAPGIGRVDAAQERRLLGRRLLHLVAQGVELRVARRRRPAPAGAASTTAGARRERSPRDHHEHCGGAHPVLHIAHFSHTSNRVRARRSSEDADRLNGGVRTRRV